MPPLQVAVVGAGSFGRNHLRVYRELESLHPQLLHLAALVEPQAGRRAELAAQYNIPAFASVADLLGAPGPSHLGTRADTTLGAPGPSHLGTRADTTSGAPGPSHLGSRADTTLGAPGPSHLGTRADTTSGAPGPDSRTRVNAASVCVPTLHHAAVAEQLLLAGVDVLVEKPFAATLADADRLLALAQQHARILAVGHLERFNPAVTALASRITRPMFFEAHRLSIFTPRSLDVDVVLDLMIHDLDIVLALTNSPLREVRAVGLPVLSPKVDIANVRLEFDSGCIANFTASRVSTELVRKLRLFQPHQYLSLDFARQELLSINVDPAVIAATIAANPRSATGVAVAHANATAHPSAGLSMQQVEVPHGEPLRLELESFLTCVRDRTPPRVSGTAGRAALALALEINDRIAAHARRAGLT